MAVERRLPQRLSKILLRLRVFAILNACHPDRKWEDALDHGGGYTKYPQTEKWWRIVGGDILARTAIPVPGWEGECIRHTVLDNGYKQAEY